MRWPFRGQVLANLQPHLITVCVAEEGCPTPTLGRALQTAALQGPLRYFEPSPTTLQASPRFFHVLV